MEIDEEELNGIITAAENILRFVGRIQGRADSYAARRDELKIIQFPARTVAGGKTDSEMNTRAEADFYSEEEIKKMPKLKEGRFRKTREGLWQVRYRRGGNDIQFTSKDRQTVVNLFREWVKETKDDQKGKLPKKAQNFGEFAERYFENVKRANVSAETYATQFRCLQMHVLPKLGGLALRQITPMKCQELLNGIISEGKGRTAETVKFILGEVLNAAIGEKLIADSPMKFVKIPKHQRQNGTALFLEEIREFLKACEGSPYRKQFAVYLYTGIRRNELHGAVIGEEFIVVPCGKCRKGQKQQFRKIPIAPALRPFLPLSAEELAVGNDVLTGNFKKLCPAHHLYDLRHTFTTRAIESGVSKTLVDVWTGHKDNRDMTATVYTHFTDDFQLREIEKLDF